MGLKEDDNQVALFAWLKKQQVEAEVHRLAVVKMRATEDELYISLLADMLMTRKLSVKTQVLCMCFAKHKKDGKNFTASQRSIISSMYYK